MNGKERMIAAMGLKEPDRVPVMCQLSIGHLLLQTDVSPIDLWYTAEGCARAWVQAQRKYRFDGILLNLCGPDPDVLNRIDRTEENDKEYVIHWKPGSFDYTHTVCPKDELPHNVWPNGEPSFEFAAFDPDREIPEFLEWMPVSQGMKYPIVPHTRLDTIKAVQSMTEGDSTLHGEVFSPWDYYIALFGFEKAFLGIYEDAGKAHAILDRFADLCVLWAKEQISAGVDAITLSSPWAGGSLISRDHYKEFVLPYERRLNTAIRESGAFCCTHTCGSLGDRLDLLLESNTSGIECLDPPPIGNVELADAKALTRGKAFIKGNIDSVNTLLHGSVETVKKDAQRRVEIAKEGGGYILSAACSVAPHVPPENLEVLYDVVEECGKYE